MAEIASSQSDFNLIDKKLQLLRSEMSDYKLSHTRKWWAVPTLQAKEMVGGAHPTS